MSDGTVYKYDSNWNYIGHIDGNNGTRGPSDRAQYNQMIGSGISIGPTSFESATTGLINAFEGGTSTSDGLILGGLPGGNTGWGALGQKPLIL